MGAGHRDGAPAAQMAASTSARRSTGMPASRAATTSGFVGRRWRWTPRRPRRRRRCGGVVADAVLHRHAPAGEPVEHRRDGVGSLPLTSWPMLGQHASRSALMPAPPTPTMCTRRGSATGRACRSRIAAGPQPRACASTRSATRPRRRGGRGPGGVGHRRPAGPGSASRASTSAARRSASQLGVGHQHGRARRRPAAGVGGLVVRAWRSGSGTRTEGRPTAASSGRCSAPARHTTRSAAASARSACRPRSSTAW